MNKLDALQSVLDKTTTIIDGIKPDQLHLPTPCTEYSVQQLLDHLKEWMPKYVEQATGKPMDAGTSLGDATKLLVTGLRDEATDNPPSAEMLVIEFISHGWDLAMATGQTVPYTDDEAAVALPFGEANLGDEYRGPGQPFGHKVTPPADASVVEQLIAFMGRPLDWTAST